MMRASLLAAVSAVAMAVATGTTGHAAPQETERPRIGLALSGGGARGLAHVGVLRWFEENRIPIDLIAGTSMGAAIGGMYAAGMSPDAVAQLVLATDWEEVLGAGAYPDLTFRRKQDQREFSTSFEVGWRGGLRLPRGLNEAHAIGLILDRVTLPYNALGSFDELPIRFRSLATELVGGTLTVFDRGSLSEALRASMALPGIFTPAAIGDGIYADGGILNNIPTDVVREMGAEFVIAVNVGSPLYGRDQLDSMLDVLTQSIAVMGIQNDRRNLELADVALTPELEGYTLIDFSDPAEVMDLGYASAASQGEALLAHGLDEARWQAHLADRGSRVRAGTSVPETVGVVGAGETSSRGIERALSRHLNRPLDTDELEPDLTRIVGAGRFASLGYEVIPEGRLVVRAREKSHGPPFLRMGLDVDAATDGNLDISIAARLTAMDFGSAGAEWRTDLRLGTRHAAATEYYRPLGPAGLFFAARAWSRASTEGLFESGNRIAELRTRDHGAGLDLGFSLERSGELRAGYEWRGASARIQTGDPLFPSREGYFRSAFLRWEFEGYDRAIIPTRGVRGRLEARWFSEDGGLVADLIRAELDLAAFHPVSRRGSIFATLGAGRTFRRDPLPVQQFTLGGPFRLSAWNRGEFRDGRFAVGSIGYLHDVGTFLPPLADRLYAAAFLEAGRLYTAPNPTGFLGDFALAFGTPSPLGALWLGGAFGEGGESKVFFRIGRLF